MCGMYLLHFLSPPVAYLFCSLGMKFSPFLRISVLNLGKDGTRQTFSNAGCLLYSHRGAWSGSVWQAIHSIMLAAFTGPQVTPWWLRVPRERCIWGKKSERWKPHWATEHIIANNQLFMRQEEERETMAIWQLLHQILHHTVPLWLSWRAQHACAYKQGQVLLSICSMLPHSNFM